VKKLQQANINDKTLPVNMVQLISSFEKMASSVSEELFAITEELLIKLTSEGQDL